MSTADINLSKENKEQIKSFPDFSAGDTINVHVKIREGNKERIQQFQGTVLQRKNVGSNGETFTVRKISDSIAVEKIMPIFSPNIEKLEELEFFISERERAKAPKSKKKFNFKPIYLIGFFYATSIL